MANYKDISVNRIAYHDYFVDEKYEAGIKLEGAEVKSLREGKVNLKDSFCLIAKNEIFLKNTHIAVYDNAGKFNNHDAKRDRKLLLKKAEIIKLSAKVSQKGYALIPLKLYFKDSLVKVELGLCRGKHTFDKKQSLKEKDIKRSAEREISNYNK